MTIIAPLSATAEKADCGALASCADGPSQLWLIVTFADQGPVAMPVRTAADYVGSEQVGSETLFHTRLADGTIQTYHATDAVLTAYVGNDMQRQLEAQAYEARRAGVNALAPDASAQDVDTGWTCYGTQHCARSYATTQSPWKFYHYLWVSRYAPSSWYYAWSCESPGGCDTGTPAGSFYHANGDAPKEQGWERCHKTAWLGHKLVSTQASRGTYLTELVTSGQIDLYNGGWSC